LRKRVKAIVTITEMADKNEVIAENNRKIAALHNKLVHA